MTRFSDAIHGIFRWSGFILKALLFVFSTAALAATYPAAFSSPSDLPITSDGFSATGHDVDLSLGFIPDRGLNLTVIHNTGRDFIQGTFSNLAQGQTVDLTHGGVTCRFVANYFGGNGNDLVLQWAATRLHGWGDNFYGELGTGDTRDRELATPVTTSPVLAGQTIIGVAAGPAHSLALRADGKVIAWGSNSSYGALGDGTTSSRLEPVLVNHSGQLAGRTVVAVDAGFSFSVALTSDGRVFSWGYNDKGQLGNATTNVTANPLPVAVSTSGLLAGRRVVAISAGYSHVLALCADGLLVAWGENTYRQLGNGTTTSSSVPVAVDTSGALSGKSVVAISAGGTHNLALCSDGTLVAWGSNDSGKLGDGSTVSSSVPIHISGNGFLLGKTVVAIAAGSAHSLVACADGTLAAWGFNGSGRLGDGTSTDRHLPTEVNRSKVPTGSFITTLSASAQNSFAFLRDGSVFSWGAHLNGRLGFGASESSMLPTQVFTEPLGLGETFLGGRSGMNAAHTLIISAVPPIPRIGMECGGTPLTSGGSTRNFGNAVTGQSLGLVSTLRNSGLAPLVISGMTIEGPDAADFSVTPPASLEIPAGGSTAFSITFHAGSGFERRATLRISSNDPFLPEFTCDLSATVRGSLSAVWNTANEVPLAVRGFSPGGSTVGLTLNHTPVTGATLKLIENSGGGVIDGSFDNLPQGQQIALVHQGVTYWFLADYFGGDGNDLVLRWAETRLFSWGSNSESQLGDGGLITRTLPYDIPLRPGSPVMMGTTGTRSSFALQADGMLQAWGSNSSQQLGIGSTVTRQHVPAAVDRSGVLSGRMVVAVSAGEDFTLVLCSDGTLAAWGWNTANQLGPATTASFSASPLEIPMIGALAGKRVTAIATGQSHSLALCSDGTIASWGDNWRGELGNGGSLNRATPVTVSTTGVLSGKRVIAIAAGNDHSLALCDDGTLAAWGDNSDGQLGNGKTLHSRVPVLVDQSGVLAGRKAVAITAGLYHSLALCDDGTIVGWGSNSEYQLGLNGTADRLLPVVVPAQGELAGRTVVAISAYRAGSLARCSDGELVVWGSNSSGEHGLGYTDSLGSPLPVRISTSTLPVGGRFAEISDSPLGSHLLGIVALPPEPFIQVRDSSDTVLVSGSSSLDFPADLVGSSPNLTLNLGNLRGGPLVVSEMRFTGAHAGDFTISRSPVGAVEAGDQVPFQIAFTTTGAGQREASLEIVTNDPASPFVIHLTATAGASHLLHASYSDGTWIPLSTHGFIATGNEVAVELGFAPPVGTRLTVIENTSTRFIEGTFGNLAHGQEITLLHLGVPYHFVADYFGGDGNDLVLVPARGRLLSWGGNASGNLGNGSTQPGLRPAAVNQSGVLLNKTILSVATGGSHSLALCSDGTIAAWGLNTNGQLGNGTTTSSTVPVLVDASGVLSGRRVVAVAAGTSFSLALCSDGRVAAWGLNSSGQLGNGTTTTATTPVLVDLSGVLAGRTVSAISAGSNYCLALCADNALVAWGDNSAGKLGNGTSIQSTVPVAVNQSGNLLGKQIIAIAGGSSHSMALCSDGTVAAWGSNFSGQLGTGLITSSQIPVPVSTATALNGVIVTNIAAGANHSLALARDGRIFAWGSNSDSQLGTQGISLSKVPVPLARTGALSGKKIVVVSAGTLHSVALANDGSLIAWGNNASGQLGDSSITSTAVPVAADMSLAVPGARFIRGGSGAVSSHRLAIVAEPPAARIVIEHPPGIGLASGHGNLSFPLSDIGNGIAQTITVRNTGSATLTGFSYVTSGTADGDFLVTSGPNLIEPGETGSLVITFSPASVGPRVAGLRIGSNDPLTPEFNLSLTGAGRGDLVAVTGDPATPAASFDSLIATGSMLHLSLDRAPPPGAVLTVVRNTARTLIEGEFTNIIQDQKLVLSFESQVYPYLVNYYGGSGNDLVLVPAGSRTLSWGANTHGQLGTGNTSSSLVPVPARASAVLAGRTVLTLAAGERHSIALCADGFVASWGNNSSGQLGRGSFTSSTSPVAVNTATGALVGKRVVSIAAGGLHSLALCADGTVVSWGEGLSGQLGDGSFVPRNLPVAVSTSGILASKSVIAIAAGGNHSVVLCHDGTIATWGDDSSGQLGNGANGGSSVPVALVQSGVLVGKTVVGIAAGRAHNLALCDDGSIVSWGSNTSGALGDGTTTTRQSPVLVSTSGVLAGRRVVAIAAGDGFSMALCEDGFLAAWGSNSGGRLGDGTTTSRLTPVAINTSGLLAGANIVSITAFAQHAVATLGNGTLATWGQNSSGQLGNGTINSSNVPTLVSIVSPPPGGAFVKTAMSGCTATHSLAMQVETPRVFFASWAAANGLNGSPGRESAFSDDPDGDGVSNGLEWILEGNPLFQDASSLIQTTGTTAAGLSLVFRRSVSALGAKLELQWDTDLHDEFAFRFVVGRDGVPANGNNPRLLIDSPQAGMVTIIIPSANAINGRIFARLSAEQP